MTSSSRRFVEIARVLKPGGRLVMNVAALKMLHGRHSVLSEEVRRYTPKRLRWIVESAGFRIERLSFAHAGILPILLPVRMWHRFAARNGAVPAGESEITVPSAPVNAAMSALVGARGRGAAAHEHADRQLADVPGAEAAVGRR